MADEEMKICGTCEKEIPKSKMRMHEIGCARNNYKCRECGEVVAKNEKEEHEETAHKLVVCQYCNYSATAGVFKNHETTCDMLPKPCQFCDEIFGFETWVNHVESCGTKTMECLDCNSFIMKKNWNEHSISG